MDACRALELAVTAVGNRITRSIVKTSTDAGPYPSQLSQQLRAPWSERSAIAVTRPARSLAAIVKSAWCHVRAPPAATLGDSDFIAAGADGERRTAARAT
jgi:hypothetical protein